MILVPLSAIVLVGGLLLGCALALLAALLTARELRRDLAAQRALTDRLAAEARRPPRVRIADALGPGAQALRALGEAIK